MSKRTTAPHEPLEVERSYEPDDGRLRRLLQLLLRDPAQTQRGIMLNATENGCEEDHRGG
jgi:hypothetical protein